MKILNDIVSSLDNNDCNQVKMLMVDYSKAFDVVDHLVVLRKFNDLNLPWESAVFLFCLKLNNLLSKT